MSMRWNPNGMPRWGYIPAAPGLHLLDWLRHTVRFRGSGTRARARAETVEGTSRPHFKSKGETAGARVPLTAEAVRSQIYRVVGVKSVYVRQNRMDYIVDGMNPHSIEATVYGGDPDDVGAALLASVPAGCETLGGAAVTVLDSVNQAHVMRYNKATRVNIYKENK